MASTAMAYARRANLSTCGGTTARSPPEDSQRNRAHRKVTSSRPVAPRNGKRWSEIRTVVPEVPDPPSVPVVRRNPVIWPKAVSSVNVAQMMRSAIREQELPSRSWGKATHEMLHPQVSYRLVGTT